jgi:hypothetical protein
MNSSTGHSGEADSPVADASALGRIGLFPLLLFATHVGIATSMP